jgi:hypothetical protein
LTTKFLLQLKMGCMMTKPTTDAMLAKWIEPEISTLDIDETQLFPGTGGDGSPFPDCTRS